MRHDYTCATLRREIERRCWASGESPGHYSVLPVRHIEKVPERYECFLTETLLTGLETKDALIAVRCYGQACAYSERLPNKGGSLLCDALMELRNRIERMLTHAAPTLKPLLASGEL